MSFSRASLRTWPFAVGSSLVALALAAGCATLDPINLGECGNKIVEAGEDCDGSVPNVIGPDGKPVHYTCAGKGEPGACHFVTTNDSVCPAGLHAGTDGICHKPSGTFTPGSSAPVAGIDPQIGDFDGDGNHDVLLDDGDKALLAFFDGTTLRQAVPLDKTRGASPSIASFIPSDVTGAPDSATDLLYPIGQAEAASFLVGTKGGLGPTLTPKAYASNDPGVDFRELRLPASVLTKGLHGDLDVAGLLLDCRNNNPGLCAVEPVAGLQIFVVAPPAPNHLQTIEPGFKGSLNDLIIHDLLSLPANPCADLVIGFAGADHLTRVPVCSQGTTLAPPTQITLPPAECAAPSIVSAFVADVGSPSPSTPEKLDGYPDLVISAACSPNGPTEVFVLLGQADGSLAAAAARGAIAPPIACNNVERPGELLAMGDLDGDGVLDYVFSDGIALSRATLGPFNPLTSCRTISPTASWDQAVTVDINRDGIPDVVALHQGDTGLDVYLGGTFSLLAPTRLNAPAPIHSFAIGDFDGDSVNDIVIDLQADHATPCSQDTNLIVFFGKAFGFPQDGTVIGSLPAIKQLLPLRAVADPFTAAPGDSISDLGVVDVCTQGEVMRDKGRNPHLLHQTAVFGGAANRVLVSPYHLRLPNMESLPATVAATAVADVTAPGAGALAGPDGSDDILALVRHRPSSAVTLRLDLLSLAGEQDGSIPTPTPAQLVAVASSPAELDPQSIPSVAVIEKADPKRGPDDWAPLAHRNEWRSGDSATGPGIIVAYGGPPSTAGVTLTLKKMTKNGVFDTIGTTSVGFELSARLRLSTGDYDQDGHVDIAILATENETVGEPRRALAIAYGNGDGTFQPPCVVASTNGGALSGITELYTGGTQRTPAIATTSEVFLLPKGIAGCDMKAAAPVALASTLTSSNAKASTPGGVVLGIAAADMNNDAIDDLVVVRTTGLQIFVQGTTDLR